MPEYMTRLAIVSLAALLALAGCGGGASADDEGDFDLSGLSWAQIEARAEGQTVNLVMWQGDPYINEYMRGYVAPALQQRYGIALNMSGGQGNAVVSALMTEKEAGAAESQYDMMWINGETFYQLRQIDALYGPFLEKLPNARYLDLGNPFIGVDFQQPIEGYEAPWGNVQFVMVYDTTRVQNPPQTRAELADWVKKNPGRFTFPANFTGMTFLKALLIDIAGGPEKLSGSFDEDAYDRYAPQLWVYLNRIKGDFWKNGETFPQDVAQVHQMFARGEIDFTMSNNDGEVDNKVVQGVLPETARGYVPEGFGSIQNTHYFGIARRAPHKAAALVVANFMMSPEAQLRKLRPRVWGDGTVLDVRSLPDSMRRRFQKVADRQYGPARAEIEDEALQELAPQYMIRLYDDFRSQVIEQ